jgi:diguanylate cyclase (GGDEF)-like protein
VARIGGDEFIVMMPEINPEGMQIVLDRVRSNFAAFNQDSSFPWHLSISLGVAVYDSTHPVTLEALMATADQSMYQAKQRSRLAS